MMQENPPLLIQTGLYPFSEAKLRIMILKQTVKRLERFIRVGDGIATIHGLDHVMYGEIVVFDCGIKGMVQDVKRTTIGCIIFGNDNEIHEGSKVRRTHKNAGIPVGEAFIGRIVNSLGEAIDGKGDIVSDEFRLIEIRHRPLLTENRFPSLLKQEYLQ